MIADQVFELCNVDADAVTDHVTGLIGACDIFLGGSLADDLGTVNSDIDLYCFRMGSEEPDPLPIISPCGDAMLELHVATVDAERAKSDSLQALIVDDDPPPPQLWPLISPQRFRQMHALYRDRALRAGEPSQTARRALAADLLHIYAALRATLTAGILTEDLLMFQGSEHTTARLYCARLVVENSIDAALAARELVNPNPKWRLLLAKRAQFTDPDFPNPDELLSALFPDISDPEKAISRCLSVAGTCLEIVHSDGILRRFDTVSEALELVNTAADLPRHPLL